jgi:hypothetical protein
MSLVSCIPLDIIGSIREFVISWSLDTGKLRNELFEDWRNFLNCCKTPFFQEMKKQFAFYNLNQQYSDFYLLYYEIAPLFPVGNPKFDEIRRIVTFFKNSSHQISLCLVVDESLLDKVSVRTFCSVFSSIYGVIISGIEPLPLVRDAILHSLENVFFLLIENWNTDIKAAHLREVQIIRIFDIHSVDISEFRNCQELTLDITLIHSLEPLVNIRRVDLSRCSALTVNEIPLMKNHYLSLGSSFYVSNPANLGSVYELHFSGGSKIRDFSSFSSVTILNLRGTFFIEHGFPTVNKFKHLTIFGKTNISLVGIHKFDEKQKKNMKLTIIGCFPDDKKLLNGIENLEFQRIQSIELDSNISWVRALVLSHCSHNSFSLPSLPYLTHLTLDSCELYFNHTSFPRLAELKIEHFSNGNNIILKNNSLQRLIINEVYGIQFHIHVDLQLIQLSNKSKFASSPIELYLYDVKINEWRIKSNCHTIINR